MNLTPEEKAAIRDELVSSLRSETEIRKIVIFGSFVHSDTPRDLDVAVFQESDEAYLPLALKYRGRTQAIARRIPMDIIPVKIKASGDPFLLELDQGIVVYER